MFTELLERAMGLDEPTLTRRFRELELERRRVEAEMAAVVAAVDHRGAYRVDGHLSLKGWMLANANWSGAEAAACHRKARLVDHCPVVGEALLSGRVGLAQVAELAKARSNPRCGLALHEVAEVMVEHAEQLAFSDFRAVVRRWEMLADADGAHRDAARTQAARRASMYEVDGGFDLQATGGSALVTAEMLGIFDRFIEAEFRCDVAADAELQGPETPASHLPRTAAQRRFDALAQIFRTAASSPAGSRPPEPVVNVLVDEHSFESVLARHHLGSMPDERPLEDLVNARCETDSGVPVPSDEVLLAAMTGYVRRVVMSSDGVIIDLGRRRRLFTGAARVAARLMSRHCSHLGCTISGVSLEVDHIAEWDRDAGRTDASNADLDCTSHNRHKHKHGSARRDSSGRVVHYRSDGTAMRPVGQRPLPERSAEKIPEPRPQGDDTC